MDLFFRTALYIPAAVLCYIALFLYEDEEREVRNRIELWWLRLSDASCVFLSGHARILQSTAGFIAHQILSRSRRTNLYVNLWHGGFVALAGPVLLLALLLSTGFDQVRELTVAGLLLLSAFLPAIRRRWKSSDAALAGLAFFFAWPLVHDDYITVGVRLGALAFSPIATGLYLLVLLVIAHLLKGLANAVTPRSFLLSCGGLLLLLTLLWFPWLAVGYDFSEEGGIAEILTIILAYSVVSILPVASIPILVLLVVMIALPLHHILWRSIERFVYALARHGALANRRLLIGSAVVLVGVAETSKLKGLLLGALSVFLGR